jgi:hypothetical protein
MHSTLVKSSTTLIINSELNYEELEENKLRIHYRDKFFLADTSFLPLKSILDILCEGPVSKSLFIYKCQELKLNSKANTFLYTQRYGKRGYRYCLIEAGHMAQNMILECCYKSISQVPCGAHFEDELNRFLKLNQNDSIIYSLVIGYDA